MWFFGKREQGKRTDIDVQVMRLPNHFSIVGEAQTNRDGSDRQKIIAHCKAGQAVRLRREPKNPHDPNAVAVVTTKGGQIGYLSRADAASVVSLFDDGVKTSASIWKIVGGTKDKPSRGVLIDVEWDV